MKGETPIIWHKTIDSTNSEAKRQIGCNDKMAVHAAEFQTAGRGQRGNRWESAVGENLTFSILIKPDGAEIPNIPANGQFRLSIVSALSVADFITSYGVECRIKWPNDIYVRDRKICGMLIENILEGDMIGASIIGIGINLNQRTFPPELMNPTSLLIASGKHVSPSEALPEFMEIFRARLAGLSSPEGRQSLREEYEAKMYRRNAVHLYRNLFDGEEFEGTVLGISSEGLLVVRTGHGETKKFNFKEIGYIL